MPRPRPSTALTLSAGLILAAAIPVAAVSDGESSPAEAQGAALEELLAHIPTSHRETCRADLSDDEPDARMSVRCELPSGIEVRYTSMRTATGADERFARRLDLESIEPDSGDCSAAVPAEQGYTIGGEPAGRLLCYESLGYDTFHWTHDATGIHGSAFLADDLDALWTWWIGESGPLTTAEPDTRGLGLALDELLGRVPEGHRSSCLPFDGGGLEDGVVVSLRCEADPDVTVYYHAHTSLETLLDEYEQRRLDEGVERDSGDCSQALPAEQAYTIGGEPAGRILCTDFFDSVWLEWTHEPSAILGTIASDLDLAETWQWWLGESGPLP